MSTVSRTRRVEAPAGSRLIASSASSLNVIVAFIGEIYHFALRL